MSADRLAFNYGIFGEFYISVADLETFAQEVKITPKFNYYAKRVSPENLAKLRYLLNHSFDVNRVNANVFLNLPIGKELIKEIAKIINSPTKVSLPALKASLILAANKSQGGLKVLDVLRLYSTKTLKLNIDRIIEAVDEANKILVDTEKVFQILENEEIAKAEYVNSLELNSLVDLSQADTKKWHREFLTIEPNQNQVTAYISNRRIQGVVYLPVDSHQPAPLIVIAPGLNTNWQEFGYIARHLASYGFGVATLNFPGTNATRVNAVLNKLDTPPSDNEWIEQPKIITLLLDEIEQKSQNDRLWQNKLDLQKVGVIGQSLGGYTSLAIAGAKVNWQQVQRKCAQWRSREQINLNPAVYWQCQSSTATPPNTDLSDSRIIAAIAINPVSNPIFDRAGMNRLKVPLAIVAGDKDLFAPALDEQLKPFTWLSDSQKYLVLVKNSTHFSFIDEQDTNNANAELSSQIEDLHLALARSYLKFLSVAFFQTYVAQQQEFSNYLTDSYAKTVSKEQLPLTIIRSLNSDKLSDRAFAQTRASALRRFASVLRYVSQN
ncbi:alpha/beta hydrolase [Myxosarcina sp. GI1]|uniref:alpha/beta hydrolase n=1 Tax=Myxosarcina sp. GI1 TaxID=1541065 RepID=UPI000A8F2206|nr:alpha/beta hydrolase [Myxosarcina sp. GI1]